MHATEYGLILAEVVAALKRLREHTVHIIQPFAILTCQLFVSKRTSLATNMCASSQTGHFFTMAYMCHVMKPCQVSCFLGEFLIYCDLKTEILNVSG